MVPGVRQSDCRASIDGSSAYRFQMIEKRISSYGFWERRVSVLLRVATGGLTILWRMLTHPRAYVRAQSGLDGFLKNMCVCFHMHLLGMSLSLGRDWLSGHPEFDGCPVSLQASQDLQG